MTTKYGDAHLWAHIEGMESRRNQPNMYNVPSEVLSREQANRICLNVRELVRELELRDRILAGCMAERADWVGAVKGWVLLRPGDSFARRVSREVVANEPDAVRFFVGRKRDVPVRGDSTGEAVACRLMAEEAFRPYRDPKTCKHEWDDPVGEGFKATITCKLCGAVGRFVTEPR